MGETSAPFTWAGSVSHGTLRDQDLLAAFWGILLDLGADRIDHQAIERERKAYLAFSGAYDRDPDYSQQDVWRELDNAQELLSWLEDQLKELAPKGYYFGMIEGDGSDYGFWATEEPTVTAERLDQLINPYMRVKATDS